MERPLCLADTGSHDRLTMIFRETQLKGAYLIEPEPAIDDRGFFARVYCQDEFSKRGLKLPAAQCNVSYNRRKGTLRGMHYQVPPFSEAKLVTCLSGAIYDVIIDLRRDSPTYSAWFSVTLNASHPRVMLYVPEQFAHGFQTLEDNTEVLYQMSEFYRPSAAKGLRWDDPAFNIAWPLAEPVISERDRQFSDFHA
jgi:dTDP-4-dehydrorhamnose 3,5-epimerase